MLRLVGHVRKCVCVQMVFLLLCLVGPVWYYDDFFEEEAARKKKPRNEQSQGPTKNEQHQKPLLLINTCIC